MEPATFFDQPDHVPRRALSELLQAHGFSVKQGSAFLLCSHCSHRLQDKCLLTFHCGLSIRGSRQMKAESLSVAS